MKLYLIRHGETVDNVAQLYAGSTDSALTSHGFLQTSKLGSHLADSNVKLTHVFSSDLQRARKTAESLIAAQHAKFSPKAKGDKAKDDKIKDDKNKAKDVSKLELVQFASLREQDFGSLELCSFLGDSSTGGKRKRTTRQHAARLDRSDPGFRDVESKDSLALRTGAFVEASLIPIMFAATAQSKDKEPVVAVVSHGMTLLALWRSLLARFALWGVKLAPGVEGVRKDRADDFQRMVGWSNTGFLELHIQHQRQTTAEEHRAIKATRGVLSSLSPNKTVTDGSKVLYDWTMTIHAINHTPHLRGLKRTRGGVGSAKHEEDQKPLESYFKKRRKME